MLAMRNSRVLRTIPLLITICLFSFPAQAQYGGGTGAAHDPYLIYTAEQMNEIGLHEEDWDKHFKLMADIDLSAYTGTSYNIIGTDPNNPFTGVFDGNGYTISKFKYSSTDTDYIALFGYVKGENAAVKDLGLINPSVDAGQGSYLGPLVGCLSGGTITACYAKGESVSGSGVVGRGFVRDLGTVIDGFENIGDWSLTGTGASYEVDETRYRYGNKSIKVNAMGGNPAWIDKTCLSLDFSDSDRFTLWYYVHDTSSFSSVGLHFTSTANWSKYFKMNFYAPGAGWNCQIASKSNFKAIGGESWDNTMITMRLMVRPKAGEDTSVNFDDIRIGYSAEPKVILTFDDNFAGQRDKAYPIMSANAQKGVAFICHKKIGMGNRMSLADMRMLRDDGWDICNHTISHPCLTAISQEELETEINGMYDYLVTNGFKRTAKFFAYPGGYFCEGMFNDAVIAKVKERHVLARQTTGSGHQAHVFLSQYDDRFKLYAKAVKYTTTVASIKAKIDDAIDGNELFILLFHEIVDSGADNDLECLTTDFQEISDYLKTKEDAGELEVITFTDYYKKLTENLLKGRRYVGGLVGNNEGGIINNCYSSSIVVGTTEVGGLAGYNGGTINNCYATGSVSGMTNVGGLVGCNNGMVSASFWGTQTTGQTHSEAGTGLPTAEMQMESTFTDAGWDFVAESANGTEDIWWILEGQDYPRLTWELIEDEPEDEPNEVADSLARAVDTDLSFITGGSADWFSQTTTSYHDGDAAQSGDISGNQESWMQTTVSGKGTVKFYWKVSSEEDFDCLEFYIDGSLLDQISGSVNWQQETYTISTSGSHVLEWRYMKDRTTSFGDDCGWVDKVEWVTN